MKSILIVEDEGLLRMSLIAVLSDKYDVHAVASGLEAIRYLRENEMDIVLLDMMMSDVDGVTVLSRLRSVRPSPSVIIHSVMSDPVRVAKIMRLGASDYLVKPCGASAVREAIERALKERAQRQRSIERTYALSA